ncbi:MAG: signal peptidase I [SAR202 cluster bacterium]|nr:signal peptidase I [SAR202 cluster bacterium]
MRSIIRESIETITPALFVLLVVHQLVGHYEVHQSSMLPRLTEGDRVLVHKAAFMEIDAARAARWLPWVRADAGDEWHPFGEPGRGDIIVFHWPRDPSQDFVKRVIGLPGDTVEIRSGTVYVNGAALDEPYVQRPLADSHRAITVQPERYYVLGDNRAASDDSRDWGTVPADLIVGKVQVSFWPLEHFSFLTTVATAP